MCTVEHKTLELQIRQLQWTIRKLKSRWRHLKVRFYRKMVLCRQRTLQFQQVGNKQDTVDKQKEDSTLSVDMEKGTGSNSNMPGPRRASRKSTEMTSAGATKTSTCTADTDMANSNSNNKANTNKVNGFFFDVGSKQCWNAHYTSSKGWRSLSYRVRPRKGGSRQLPWLCSSFMVSACLQC